MDFALAGSASAAGYRLASYETIGSTNDEAMARARAGETGPLWIVSTHQTKGRGRRGRQWQTAPGNLASSLLLVLDLPPQHLATLGFVSSLALTDALLRVAPDLVVATALDGASTPGTSRFELKWPNDVVAAGAKIAGIMLESEVLSSGRTALVVGIGVNVVSPPDGIPYPATCLEALGVEAGAEALFTALTGAWMERHAIWDGGRGMAAVRTAWLQRAAGIGGPVAVGVGARVVRGTFETLDEDGCLVVRESNGSLVTIAAGDAHFGTVATLPAAG